MNELIKVESHLIGGQAGIRTVNARELHGFLGIGKAFAAWIQERIAQYGFTEELDFVCRPVLESKGRGGHNRKDYHITLDMAKELAMVERNEKGKQARQYFIECERKLRSAPAVPQSLPEALRLAADLAEKNTQQEKLLEQQKPAVEFVKKYAEAESSKGLSDVAKLLGWKPHAFTRQLAQDGIDSAPRPLTRATDGSIYRTLCGVAHAVSTYKGCPSRH